MALTRKRLVKELVRAAFEFHALRPWEAFLNEDVVPLRIPGQELPAFASILGAAGDEFGLSVFLGEDAAFKLLVEFGAEMQTEDTFENDHLVAFTMTPLAEFVPWARDLLELGGYRGRREIPAPWFMAKKPGQHPRRPDRDELEVLLFALRGVIRLLEEGLVEPTNLEPGEGRTIFALSGDARRPDVAPETFDLIDPFDGLSGALGGEAYRVPEPDDLDGWKAADRAVTDRMIELLGKNRITDGRAIARYFGSEKTGRKLLDGPVGDEAAQSYVEWLMWCHRSEPLAPTYGQRSLDSGRLLPAERTLFRSRLKARRSVYRVDRVADEGRIDLVDIFDGSRFEIRDFSMAGDESVVDACIPLAVYPAGSFFFVFVAGPPLVREVVEEAMELLEQHVSPLSAGTLAAKPEVLGRLWVRHERELRKPPPRFRFVNGDGHVVAPRNAEFPVDDPAAVTLALRKDEEFEQDGEDLIWVRSVDETGVTGTGRVIAGRLEARRGRILADTNSAERMEELRARLEALPGVGTGTVEILDLAEFGRPPKPGPGVREIVVDTWYDGAETQEEAERRLIDRMREHLLEWIDSELPVLGGRTPREVATTPEGRRKVKRMILAMPSPPVEAGPGVTVPREEMLRSLDLLKDVDGE